MPAGRVIWLAREPAKAFKRVKPLKPASHGGSVLSLLAQSRFFDNLLTSMDHSAR